MIDKVRGSLSEAADCFSNMSDVDRKLRSRVGFFVAGVANVLLGLLAARVIELESVVPVKSDSPYL
jgi:predicted benzoate:H+ symporter BenE